MIFADAKILRLHLQSRSYKPLLPHRGDLSLIPAVLSLGLCLARISKAIGLVEQYAVTPTAFANAAAGKGARVVPCAIALALDELPSILWPFLTEKPRQADDDLYLSSIEDDGKLTN